MVVKIPDQLHLDGITPTGGIRHVLIDVFPTDQGMRKRVPNRQRLIGGNLPQMPTRAKVPAVTRVQLEVYQRGDGCDRHRRELIGHHTRLPGPKGTTQRDRAADITPVITRIKIRTH